MNVSQLKFAAVSLSLNWPTTDQLPSSTSETDPQLHSSTAETDPRVVYVSDVSDQLSETVLLHLENRRCGGGVTEHSTVLGDGTFMVKFVDVEGWLKASAPVIVIISIVIIITTTNVLSNLAKSRIADLSLLAAANGFIRP